MPSCFLVLHKAHNKRAGLLELLTHWGIHFLDDEESSDLEARISYTS
jgi:hypothetical protein